MSLAEPLHVNSEPRDGFYWVWGKAPDPSRPMTARPKIPIKIWTVVTVPTHWWPALAAIGSKAATATTPLT